MDAEKTVRYKSKKFAVRIVHLYQYLTMQQHEYVMAKQILRCGTSIGANLAEAGCAISRKDFLAKNYIAFKECAETIYWLKLLRATEYISNEQFCSLRDDCDELRKMLSAITKTLREQ